MRVSVRLTTGSAVVPKVKGHAWRTRTGIALQINLYSNKRTSGTMAIPLHTLAIRSDASIAPADE